MLCGNPGGRFHADCVEDVLTTCSLDEWVNETRDAEDDFDAIDDDVIIPEGTAPCVSPSRPLAPCCDGRESLAGGGGSPLPPPDCTDSTPKAFLYPNTSPGRISNRQKPPPPTACTSPVTALQPLWDGPDGPPPLQAKPCAMGPGPMLGMRSGAVRRNAVRRGGVG